MGRNVARRLTDPRVEERIRKLATLLFAGRKNTEAVIEAGFELDQAKPTFKVNAANTVSKAKKSPFYSDQMRELTREATKVAVEHKGDRRDEYMSRLDHVYGVCMELEAVFLPSGKAGASCPKCAERIPYYVKLDAKNALKATEMSMIEDGMLVQQRSIRVAKVSIVSGTFGDIVGRLVTLIRKCGIQTSIAIVDSLTEAFSREMLAELMDKRGYEIVPRELRVVPGSDERIGGGAQPAEQPAGELLPATPQAG